ncbi:MAG TPA: sugar phosphate isomerase/epimerase family protein [Bacteroidota bacterium]|nr:sugar phosphate isomerase/epimerase family protein [Bacteroidota bacterium]
MAKNKFSIEAVEYVNTYFKDASPAYVAEVHQRAEDAGVRSLLIMCDAEGNLGDPDNKLRTQAVENHYKWVDAAIILGCHSIRVNARSTGTPEEQRRLMVDGLGRLVRHAEEFGINVIVENHGGLSSNGALLASVIRGVNHPMCGTLPDFGNWRISDTEEYDKYQGITELMPFAKAVSAKSFAFDAEGNESTIDYPRMMEIVHSAGYDGYIGIEYEGSDTCENGVRATKRLLERLIGP